MNIEDVDKLSELVKIELSHEEKEALIKDMDGILGYVKVIEQVEVEDVAPEYKEKNVWREDQIESRKFSKDLIVGQFPEQEKGFLKVKKIL